MDRLRRALEVGVPLPKEPTGEEYMKSGPKYGETKVHRGHANYSTDRTTRRKDAKGTAEMTRDIKMLVDAEIRKKLRMENDKLDPQVAHTRHQLEQALQAINMPQDTKNAFYEHVSASIECSEKMTSIYAGWKFSPERTEALKSLTDECMKHVESYTAILRSALGVEAKQLTLDETLDMMADMMIMNTCVIVEKGLTNLTEAIEKDKREREGDYMKSGPNLGKAEEGPSSRTASDAERARNEFLASVNGGRRDSDQVVPKLTILEAAESKCKNEQLFAESKGDTAGANAASQVASLLGRIRQKLESPTDGFVQSLLKLKTRSFIWTVSVHIAGLAFILGSAYIYWCTFTEPSNTAINTVTESQQVMQSAQEYLESIRPIIKNAASDTVNARALIAIAEKPTVYTETVLADTIQYIRGGDTLPGNPDIVSMYTHPKMKAMLPEIIVDNCRKLLGVEGDPITGKEEGFRDIALLTMGKDTLARILPPEAQLDRHFEHSWINILKERVGDTDHVKSEKLLATITESLAKQVVKMGSVKEEIARLRDRQSLSEMLAVSLSKIFGTSEITVRIFTDGILGPFIALEKFLQVESETISMTDSGVVSGIWGYVRQHLGFDTNACLLTGKLWFITKMHPLIKWCTLLATLGLDKFSEWAFEDQSNKLWGWFKENYNKAMNQDTSDSTGRAKQVQYIALAVLEGCVSSFLWFIFMVTQFWTKNVRLMFAIMDFVPMIMLICNIGAIVFGVLGWVVGNATEVIGVYLVKTAVEGSVRGVLGGTLKNIAKGIAGLVTMTSIAYACYLSYQLVNAAYTWKFTGSKWLGTGLISTTMVARTWLDSQADYYIMGTTSVLGSYGARLASAMFGAGTGEVLKILEGTPIAGMQAAFANYFTASAV